MEKATFEQYLEVGQMIKRGEIEKSLFQAVIEGKVQIVQESETSTTTKGSETVYTLTIDHSKSLVDLIAAGKFDWVNEDITAEHFPLKRTDGETGTEDREVVLVHLDEYLMTEQIKAELDRRGLKPASIVEFLALGAAYPDLQREFPVVALGSSWRDPDGSVSVPALWCDYSERDLDLYGGNSDYTWNERYRFLALRK